MIGSTALLSRVLNYMIIERTIFQSLLNTLAPALESKGIVPQFTHYCFDIGKVYSYNDIVAIEADCEFPVRGGIPGQLLSKWVSQVKGREIEITSDKDNTVALKCGRSNVQLTTMGPDEFLFTRPKDSGKELQIELERLTACLEAVLPCANVEAASPWQYGVTLHFGEKLVELYATQTYNLARATMENSHKAHKGLTLLLPPQFCELLIANRNSLTKITATSDWIVGHFEGVKIYAKLNPQASIDKYHSVCKPETRKLIKERSVSVPKQFAQALERVMLVLDTEEESFMRLQVKEGFMLITAESEDRSSRSKERLIFPGNHKPVVAHIDRTKKYLRPVLSKAKSIAIIPEKKLLALGGEGVMYLYAITKRESV